MVAIKTCVDNSDPSLDSTKRFKSRNELENTKKIEKIGKQDEFHSLGSNQLRN
jgi:hypothetical protein